jgi:hypothetical protein
MARPSKNTVDYFPHDCIHGKTLFIIEQRYGNDGYAFWFKLLENLGSVEGHYLDMDDPVHNEFLRSKTRCEDGFIDDICSLLAKLGAIDKDLWGNRIIWSQNFVDRVSDVYTKNRHKQPPQKPKIIKKELETPREDNNYAEKPSVNDITTQKSTQSKVKESKVKKGAQNVFPPENNSDNESCALPSQDLIQTANDIDVICERLYKTGKFPKAVVFRNYCVKQKYHFEAILRTFQQIASNNIQGDPWAYGLKIIKVESQNYTERDCIVKHQKLKEEEVRE